MLHGKERYRARTAEVSRGTGKEGGFFFVLVGVYLLTFWQQTYILFVF